MTKNMTINNYHFNTSPPTSSSFQHRHPPSAGVPPPTRATGVQSGPSVPWHLDRVRADASAQGAMHLRFPPF